MESASDFISITEFIKQADAYVFLAAWLWMLYTRRIRWGWDYDNMEASHKKEIEQLQELVSSYQNKVELRLEKLEGGTNEPS